MWIADNWKDYTIIDTSDGEKLEYWGKYSLIRPDPQVIWKTEKKNPLWKKADASYKRSRSGGGAWSENRLPESWLINYGDLRFRIIRVFFPSRQLTGIGCALLSKMRVEISACLIFLHTPAELPLRRQRQALLFVT